VTRDELEAVWHPAVGWDGLYDVSDLGHVRSLRSGKLLKPWLVNGYQMVGLSRDGKTAHRLVHDLVAAAFLGPRRPGQQVRHGPSGKLNNRAASLCYGTPVQNKADQRRDGTDPVGSRNGFARLTESTVSQCRIRFAAGETCQTLAAELGVDLSTVALAMSGKTWAHVEPPAVRRVRPEDRPKCPSGHDYSPANTYVTPRGHRRCRECKRIRECVS
jgi:NUMOD4 motif